MGGAETGADRPAALTRLWLDDEGLDAAARPVDDDHGPRLPAGDDEEPVMASVSGMAPTGLSIADDTSTRQAPGVLSTKGEMSR